MQIPKHGDVRGSYSFTIASCLRSSAARVWEHASTFAGVNRELWPLARMTFLPALEQLTPGPAPLGRAAFRSWVLLLLLGLAFALHNRLDDPHAG
jgi:hypothetical protein